MSSPLPELLELLDAVRQRILRLEEGPRARGRLAAELRQAEEELEELRGLLLEARRRLAAPRPRGAATRRRRSA